MVGKPGRKRLWRPSHTWEDNNFVGIELHENQVISSYCTVVLIKNLCAHRAQTNADTHAACSQGFQEITVRFPSNPYEWNLEIHEKTLYLLQRMYFSEFVLFKPWRDVLMDVKFME